MTRPIDVCLVLEGTYPYVVGGVSSWVHDLVKAQADLNFHGACLIAEAKPPQMRFEPPGNFVTHAAISLQRLAPGKTDEALARRLFAELEGPLTRLLDRGGLAELRAVLALVAPLRGRIGRAVVLDSRAAFDCVERMYDAAMPGASFLDYFWTWRALVGGLMAVLLAPVPPARLYHTISTGYAGLLAARMGVETGRPVLLTEHGIYTNERRIEIAMADWLHAGDAQGLAIEKPRRDLRDLWIDAFVAYARATYEAATEIVTLYGGNQDLQRREGAPPEKLKVIPNGIDYPRFSGIARDRSERRPTVALIGRVVPIKDLKTFIRAIGILRNEVPDVLADILGPTEEDAPYAEECRRMVAHLGLENNVRFLGRVKLDDHLGRVDVVALTSISEAQPLVMLEAGAAGIPSVVTDVGACREMIFGRPGVDAHLGPGGAVTPVASPDATAAALARLLTDRSWWHDCSTAMKERVRVSYNKIEIDRIYAKLYHDHLDSPPRGLRAGTA